MPVAALPDSIAGIVARLRSFSEISTLVTTPSGYTVDATLVQKSRPRMSGRVQSFWQLGKWPAAPKAPKGLYSLVVSGPVGSPPDDRDGAIYLTRADLHFYASSPIEAMAFWRQVHPILCPRSGTPERFVANGCRFITVDAEGGPVQLIEPDTRYCKVVASYLFRWQEGGA